MLINPTMLITISSIAFIAGGFFGLLLGLIFRAGSTDDAWFKGYMAGSHSEEHPPGQAPGARGYEEYDSPPLPASISN